MSVRWLAIATIALTMVTSGCQLCCSPYDMDYVTTGGKHQRTNMAYGRIGSPFSDPNSGNLVSKDGAESSANEPTWDSYYLEDADDYDVIEIPGSNFEID